MVLYPLSFPKKVGKLHYYALPKQPLNNNFTVAGSPDDRACNLTHFA